jgi:hypothetical protein
MPPLVFMARRLMFTTKEPFSLARIGANPSRAADVIDPGAAGLARRAHALLLLGESSGALHKGIFGPEKYRGMETN